MDWVISYLTSNLGSLERLIDSIYSGFGDRTNRSSIPDELIEELGLSTSRISSSGDSKLPILTDRRYLIQIFNYITQ